MICFARKHDCEACALRAKCCPNVPARKIAPFMKPLVISAIPLAAEIGSNDAELFSQSRRKLAPNNVGMRVAMQEKDWHA
jgi:hypothetical protein